MSELEAGQQAPDFTLESTQGTVTLSRLLAQADRGVIVYFYPKASTPGCTTEACDFRDNLNTLKGAGYTVVGISADQMPALERFAEKQSLNFPLASDPDHTVLEPWGAWGEKTSYGRTTLGIIRSTVVVAPDGRVALAQYNVKATGHVQRLRRDLGLDA
jgi:peroxiredoxin Q/BCP